MSTANEFFRIDDRYTVNPKLFAEFFQTNRDTLFKFDESFIELVSSWSEPWSSSDSKAEDVVSALVYYRTYCRNGECWYQCVQRVVEGTFRLIQRQYHFLGKLFHQKEMQNLAQDMYTRIFQMKFLPPGRGLWAMGTPIVESNGLGAALNNCAFISTENLDKDPLEPFIFLMDMTMLGVGVGSDTLGAGKCKIFDPKKSGKGTKKYVIDDSREGWVNSLGVILESYFFEDSYEIEFDYSEIRPAGVVLKTFGGVSGGSKPLQDLHYQIRTILEPNHDQFITTRIIADLFNLIGVAVVSGNVRRTAEIIFGSPDDKEFLNLKNYQLNPERGQWGWTSNNSITAKLGMDYKESVQNILLNGEPGFLWLHNAQKYSRMNLDQGDYLDLDVKGANPCNEQSLEDGELCCLVENFPTKHESFEDFCQTLRLAFLYCKTVSTFPTHWSKSNNIIMKNHRLGNSISGVAQFEAKHNLHTLRKWLKNGYTYLKDCDEEISEMLGLPLSKKLTSIKPSGTVSLLAGATPGMHYPIHRFYIRRIVLAQNSHFVKILKDAGYKVEDSAYEPDVSAVVEIPVSMGSAVRKQNEVTMWEQLHLAAFLQKYWSDNQVSATITFDPETESNQIVNALNYFQYDLKGVSFLPATSDNSCEYHLIHEPTHLIELKKQVHNIVSRFESNRTETETICVFEPWTPSVRIESLLSKWKTEMNLTVTVKKITPYKQMPYESITEEEYQSKIADLKKVNWSVLTNKKEEEEPEQDMPDGLKYCDGDYCEFRSKKQQ